MPIVKRKDGTEVDVPRTFMSPAYLKEIDTNVFAMFRDILVEEKGQKEKWGKPIGPIMIFRPAEVGEPIDFITTLADGKVLELIRTHPPREAPAEPQK